MNNLAHLLVIGGASLDTLHLGDRRVSSAGGAGMYTSMAAVHTGVKASMFAPRPDPMPAELKVAAERLTAWLGPVVPADQLPHFEIQHKGEKANYLTTFIGAEADLTPYQIPSDLGRYDCVHLTPLGDSARQQRFVMECIQKGAKRISAGTYLCTIQDKPEVIRKTIELADIFFMNEEEAILLFGSLDRVKTGTGKLLFVTRGEKGSLVVQGDHQTALQTKRVVALDPTGAGDTFCGAVLAQLMLGTHPVMAATQAMAMAAEEVAFVGPEALLSDTPAPLAVFDERVRLDHEQINRISEVVKRFEAASPFNFIGKDFPPEGHSQTVDYFFATILQQFSFWETKNERYDQPLIAVIDGDNLKGSAYLFRAFVRVLKNDPDFYSPKRLAGLTKDDMLTLFRADDGSDPMPAIDLHLQMARNYGADMLALGKTPSQILDLAQRSSTPLHTLLNELDQFSGYKEDPLRKKSNLLALCLNQRPEGFLAFGVGENVPPVIDYHTMRSCLRMGLVDVLDAGLKEKITSRTIVSITEEWAIRFACYRAVEEVVKVSGKSLGAVDWFFFSYARTHCPEMTEPICAECAVNTDCTHRKELFQPVLRTTFY